MTSMRSSVIGKRLDAGGALSAFDAMYDTLQAKTVVKRIRKTLFDMKGSHPREIHFDGRVRKRTGQKRSKQAERTFIYRARRPRRVDPA